MDPHTPTMTTSDELNAWLGAALVLDPHGRIFAATADDRARSGPVYQLPDQGIDLATLFDLTAAQDVRALHDALLNGSHERDPIFSRHSLPLLHAAVACAQVTEEHPLHVLARWTGMAALQALREAKPYAPAAVRQFTGGDDPKVDHLSTFAQSAWGTLVTRIGPLMPHFPRLTQPDIPTNWYQRAATLYVTLPGDPCTTALRNCIVQSCLWAVQCHPTQPPVLLVLDNGVPPLHLTVAFNNRTCAAGTSAIVPSLAFAHTVLANCHTRLILSSDTTDPTNAGSARNADTRRQCR